MKIAELARELNTTTKEILLLLREARVFIKSVNSAKLDPQRVTLLRQAHQRKKKKQNTSQFPDLGTTVTFETDQLSVPELIEKFAITMPILMKVFLKLGMLLNINSQVDKNTIEAAAKILNITPVFKLPGLSESQDVKESLLKIEEEELDQNLSKLQGRPPIVTIMGHVDHGKTLLLDTIRQSNLVASESGAITQHIGAYQVTVQDQSITFLDTPGHEAFTSLRARGAQVTDIAILVVAADEGLKPQSLEAIDHAKAANIPIIVAINKIDLKNANVDTCKQALAEADLTPEDWGGKTIVVPISAKAKTGINDLLDMITLLAETLELQAIYDAPAKAVVIESHLSSKKGPVCTTLIKSGTLKIGDIIGAGAAKGKVRALLNDAGENILKAEPGSPVEILGFSDVPDPGQLVTVYAQEKACVAEVESFIEAEKKKNNTQSVSLSSLSSKVEDGESNISIILKTDVHGSLEALKASIMQLSSEAVSIQLIHAATGAVTPNDVSLAQASQAFIFAFKVAVVPEAQKMANEFKLQLKTYDVIYDIITDLDRVTKGMYKSTFVDVEVGRAEVRNVFHFSKVGSIAGCMVTEGKILRRGTIEVVRNDDPLYTGKIDALRRFKEDVKEVKKDFECGVTLDKIDDIKKGDILVCYIQEEQKPF
eukprot:COSAG01_NODE_6_length_54687_cov_500.907599_10_plen_654_part_00